MSATPMGCSAKGGGAREGGTFSVGVDMDALHHYLGIHGLDSEGAGDEAWSVGMGRFLELFEQLGVKATFYSVAEDLTLSPSCEGWLKRALKAGHEVGNHSWRHPYTLTRLSYEAISQEVREGRARLESALSCEVLGFRAPGYHTNALVQRALLESGHVYESSAFPCAPYYLAKALVMGAMRLRGRSSASVLGSPRLLLAPRTPYEPSKDQPYRRARPSKQAKLTHFPVSVWWGVPLIGTALSALGPSRAAWVVRRAALQAQHRAHRDATHRQATHREELQHSSAQLAPPRGHLTLEFHAVDLLSLIEDQLDPRLSVQPDLKLSLSRKRATFEASLKACLEAGLRCERLIDLSRRP